MRALVVDRRRVDLDVMLEKPLHFRPEQLLEWIVGRHRGAAWDCLREFVCSNTSTSSDLVRCKGSGLSQLMLAHRRAPGRAGHAQLAHTSTRAVRFRQYLR